MFVAAAAFVAVKEQCPDEVMPVTVTLSLVAELVLRDAPPEPQPAVVNAPPVPFGQIGLVLVPRLGWMIPFGLIDAQRFVSALTVLPDEPASLP